MTNEDFIKSVSLEGEIWKDVVGYEGLYQVSNMGRIATLSHTIECLSDYNGIKVKKTFNIKQCLRKLYLGKHGYVECTLRNGKRIKLMKVHRIVAEAFIPNPQNLSSVNHKDEDKTNNHIDNLEWCTHKYNSNYGTRNKRIKSSLSNAHKNGLYNNSYRLKSKPIIGISLSDNSTIFFKKSLDLEKQGFERHIVSKCCRNLRLDYKGYKWMFLSDYEKSINKSKNE